MDETLQSQKDSWLHFDGSVYFILQASPFRLLLRAQARKISQRELIAEVDFLEHEFQFSSTDLLDLLPSGALVQIQLSAGGFDVIATGEVFQRELRHHQLQVHLGFKKVDAELEDLLAEIKAQSKRSPLPLH